MQNVTHRLNTFITHKNMGISEFERLIGAGNSSIHKAIKSARSINSDWLQNISDKFPELDMNWLISGRGSMLLGEAVVLAASVDSNVDFKEKYYAVLEKYNGCLEEKQAEKKDTRMAKMGG